MCRTNFQALKPCALLQLAFVHDSQRPGGWMLTWDVADGRGERVYRLSIGDVSISETRNNPIIVQRLKVNHFLRNQRYFYQISFTY